MSDYQSVSIVDLVPKQCAKCLAHFFENPMIVEAFASVGIEHGKSSGQMAKEFYEVYHKQRHRERAAGVPREAPPQ